MPWPNLSDFCAASQKSLRTTALASYWSTKHKQRIPHCQEGRKCIGLHTHFQPYRQCGIRCLCFVLQSSQF